MSSEQAGRLIAHCGSVALWVLLSLVPTVTSAQIISPSAKSDPAKVVKCGPKIKTDKVLVLDLEPYTDSEETVQFIGRHVTDLELESEESEVIRTTLRSAIKSRLSAMKRARKTAAQRGCNVVLVTEAWEGDDSAAVAQTTPVGAGSQTIAVGLHYAYARVLMGTGEH